MYRQQSTPFTFLAFLLLACAGKDPEPPRAKAEPTLAGACSSVCHKLEECDALQGSAVEDCIRGCSREEAAAVSDGADACPITGEQANACISVIGEFSCPSLKAGDFPDACSFCEERAGNKGLAGSAATKPAPDGPGCPELRTCCEQISASDQQSLCNMVARMNNPGLCAAVLPSYQAAGACK